MNNPVFNLLRKFLYYGTSPKMNELEVRRVWLFNLFYLIATFTLLAGIIETYFVEGVEYWNWILILAVTFQLGLIPLLLGKTQLAEIYFLLVANITLFVFDNLYGPEGGTYLYYFPFLLMIAFLVNFKRPVIASINIFLTVGFVIAGIKLRHKFLYQVFPPNVLDSSFDFSLFISILSMAIITFIIVRMSYHQYNQFLERIEERNAAEKSMKEAIQEKETLLAEVHHRVKNNLAVITSLLNLQMNVVNNDYTKDVLRECRNRVASMSLIHQKLYQNFNVEQIDFGSYAGELVQEIRQSYLGNHIEKITVNLDVQHLPLSLTKAVPCGLILNELLSNCYKHAFPERTKNGGEIYIHFRKSNGNYELEVGDNGVGLSDDFEMDKQESLGITIVQSLADQIDAKVEIIGNLGIGTKVRIAFQA